MKKLLLSSAALVALCTSSFAADLPRRVMAPAPAPVQTFTAVPMFTWTGFYAGLHAGYAWGPVDARAPSVAPALIGSYSESVDVDGGFFGAQAGYNVQFGNIVAGIEGDLSWADINGEGSSLGGGSRANFDIDWQGSIRGRIGVAFDRVLVYGTGGWAFAGGEGRISNLEHSGDNRRASDDFSGYVIGGGVEAAVTNNVTAKIEYLYTDYGRANFNFGDVLGLGDLKARGELDTHSVKVGVNYKFN
jgi:outer membrane immunogenic protein